jgi:hypothetical protein
MLVSTSNPVRTEPYEVQISHHNLPIKKRVLQAGLKRYTKGGQRFKQAYIEKKISPINLAARVEYGEKYQYETIESFWQYIYYTDEAHIDPSSQGVGNILCEEGTRYEAENIQQRPELKGVKLHIAGWVNWHAKCEELEFYNNEEFTWRPPTKGRPRRSKYEDKEQYMTSRY